MPFTPLLKSSDLVQVRNLRYLMVNYIGCGYPVSLTRRLVPNSLRRLNMVNEAYQIYSDA